MAHRLILFLRRLGRSGSLVLLLWAPLAGSAAADGNFEDLRTRIEVGYQQRDLASMENARADLLGLAGSKDLSPNEQASAAYFAAYARFRQALAAESDPPTVRKYLDECIVELRQVVRQQPGHAEARALLGSCLGLSTLHSVVATVTRGLEARRQMQEARRLAPDNPWVVMQDGLADWATPRLFGGDQELALTKLERAASLFRAASDGGSGIATWGAAEALQQLALRYRELGRGDDARSALERAAALTTAPLRLAAARP